ncbi:MAG: hypothetical protein QXS41_00955 [Candidatus Woesearchaeota archaeon]
MKNYKIILAFFSLFWLVSLAYSLEITSKPEMLYNSGFVSLKLQNNDNYDKKVSVISYVFEDGYKKHYVKDDYTIKANNFYEINRFVEVKEGTEGVFFIVYGDVYKEIFIPVFKRNNNPIFVENHQQNLENEKIQNQEDNYDVNYEKKEDYNCNKFVLQSLESGPSDTFYEGEKIILNIISENKPIFLNDDLLVKEIATNIYEIIPVENKPGKYELKFYLEGCGTLTVNFEILPKKIDGNTLLFFIFLVLLLVFFAVMVDLSILDSRRNNEREKRKSNTIKLLKELEKDRNQQKHKK